MVLIVFPLVGWAVDKCGSRIVILIGAIISGASFALMALVNSLIGFYIVYGVLLSIGMSAMLYLPAWTVIAKWFNRRLSFALAILGVGAGFGGLFCAPISASLIENFGWRSAFIMLGILIWCVAFLYHLSLKKALKKWDCFLTEDPRTKYQINQQQAKIKRPASKKPKPAIMGEISHNSLSSVNQALSRIGYCWGISCWFQHKI